jgi:hypothetical protein
MQRVLLAVLLCVASSSLALACGPGKPGSKIPSLAAVFDEELPNANLSQDDLTKAKALRQEIGRLKARKKVEQARSVEVEAMKILGYKKAWLKCGRGTFGWTKAAA